MTVESYDIYFEPKALTIPAATEVILSLPNEGVTLHNFSIDALRICVDIAPGATEQVVINAPAGDYEYYCNVPGHKEAGSPRSDRRGAVTPGVVPAERSLRPPGLPLALIVRAGRNARAE